MQARQLNKLRSFQTVTPVLEKHQAKWKDLPGLVKAVNDFNGIIPQITDLAQTQASRIGSTEEKARALEALGNAAYEVAAAVGSFAATDGDLELSGRVDFSRTDITAGRDAEAVALCRDIAEAAAAHVDSLDDYGIDQPKLNALNKKIDTFEELQTKPRQNVATSRRPPRRCRHCSKRGTTF